MMLADFISGRRVVHYPGNTRDYLGRMLVIGTSRGWEKFPGYRSLQ